MNHSTRKFLILMLLSLFNLTAKSQQTLNGIPPESYNNVKNSYNFTYWDSNWKTTILTNRKFTNHTSSYNLSVDYSDLRISSLAINSLPPKPSRAFRESNSVTFKTRQAGTIDVKIIKNGAVAHELNSSNPTNESIKISQLADYGTWCNRRVMDSLNFTNNAPVYGSYTGVEFTNWHNRFRISFQLKLRESIENGQMQLSVTMPEAYKEIFYSEGVYGFATNSIGEGFAVKAGVLADSVFVCGNTITLLTPKANLYAGKQYDLSLIFYAVKEDFCGRFSTLADDGKGLIVKGSQNMPDKQADIPVSYSSDEGVYFVDVPNYNMGYGNEENLDVMQNIRMEISNNLTINKRVRLCFYDDAHSNITGFSSMIRNPNGDPSGIPLQVSKNWHNGQKMLYSAHPGGYSKEYTELIVPANTTLRFDYTRVGARWGNVFAASSHQLSVVGAGVPRGGWLEAAIGSFGESITHSPDYEYGNTNACDFRPFLVTNEYYGGNSSKYSWTGNLGGMDMFRYDTENGTRIYQSEVKTRFNKYGPNLAETSISTYSSNKALKMDYSFYLSRSDDFTRVYYTIKIKALKDAPFKRFDIFQLGSDNYNLFKAREIVYGDSTGVLGQLEPINSNANDYTTGHIALTGKTPWLWAGDGIYTKGIEGINIHANNSMVIRSYKASFNDSAYNIPYFRERVSSTGYSAATGENPTSYCLVPPPDITTFRAGDSIQLQVEVCLLPKVADVYYGPNENFQKALATYGNSWEMVHREVVRNTISASSSANIVHQDYPIRVEALDNAAEVTIKGGVGYIPVIFSNLTSINEPKLYRLFNDSLALIDQSKHGKDFWQAEYDVETGLYELIFNLNHDTKNDSCAEFTYLLETGFQQENDSYGTIDVSVSDCSLSNPLNTKTLCHSSAKVRSKNIALSGTASQSSTGYGGVASRAIDGNTSGAYNQSSVTHTAGGEPSIWWKLMLDRTTDIETIRIYNRTDDCCKNRLYDFTVYILNSDTDTVFSRRFTSPPDPSLSINDIEVEGNTVLICLNGDGVLSLAEVEIYETSLEFMLITKELNTNLVLPDVIAKLGNHQRVTNNNGAVSIYLADGLHSFSLEKNGFKPVNQTVSVNSDTILTVFMEPEITSLRKTGAELIKIYPNPAACNLHLNIDCCRGGELQVLSSTGQLIMQKKISRIKWN